MRSVPCEATLTAGSRTACEYKGRLADPAVFVYHLKAWCIDGQEYFTKGNVTLVR